MRTDAGEERQIPVDGQQWYRPRIRVVLLLQDLKFGGTQRQAVEMAQYLDRSRFQVEMWMMANGDDLAPLVSQARIGMVWLSRASNVGVVSVFRLWRHLRSNRVDILMLLTVIPNIWGRLLGRLTRVPVIVGTCRGGGSPGRQHERWLWRLADHHICNSTALMDHMSSICGVPKLLITTIPNGVDTEFFRPPGTPPSAEPKIVLCVARFVPDKDHETLIHAFGMVVSRDPAAELWLVGDGYLQASVEEFATRTLPPGHLRILPGRLDLRPLLEQSRLLVLSSIREGLPNVVLEAMATALPVVATDVGGLSEVVEHNQTGLLVPERNPVALAEALLQLLSDEERCRGFGETGRKRVEHHYSISAIMGRYGHMLDHLWAARR